MSISTKMKKVAAGLVGLLGSGTAMASATGGGTAIASSSFNSFEATILAWVNGPLGIGLAVTALVIGGGAGIIKSSPMSALCGVALAAFFAWGPSIIVAMVEGGTASLL